MAGTFKAYDIKERVRWGLDSVEGVGSDLGRGRWGLASGRTILWEA